MESQRTSNATDCPEGLSSDQSRTIDLDLERQLRGVKTFLAFHPLTVAFALLCALIVALCALDNGRGLGLPLAALAALVVLALALGIGLDYALPTDARTRRRRAKEH